MKTLGTATGPKKEGFRDWPAFRELREAKEFQEAFMDVFGEPFATVTVASAASTASETVQKTAEALPLVRQPLPMRATVTMAPAQCTDGRDSDLGSGAPTAACSRPRRVRF